MLGAREVGGMRLPITVGLALFLAVGASIPGIATPPSVRADCGGSGPYARTPADVRGTAFIGVYEGYEDATDGDAIVRWDVEQVVAGDIPTGTFRKRTFECALTLLLPGERYLFTTGASAGKGMASYANSIAWLVAGDGATIAPFVDQQDPPQVAQDVTRMPAWAREVATIDEGIAQVTGEASPGADGTPSPVPSAPTPTDPPGVTNESLGVSQPEDGTVGRIELLRTTLAPGASMPPTRFVGDWLVRVESGVLKVTLVDGAAGLKGATGAEDDPISQGPDAIPDRTLGVGQVLWAGPDAVLSWENRGSEPAIVLSTAVTRGDDVVMVAIDPDARPASAFQDPVVKRIVLTGPGSTGDRYRITVADRSG